MVGGECARCLQPVLRRRGHWRAHVIKHRRLPNQSARAAAHRQRVPPRVEEAGATWAAQPLAAGAAAEIALKFLDVHLHVRRDSPVAGRTRWSTLPHTLPCDARARRATCNVTSLASLPHY